MPRTQEKHFEDAIEAYLLGPGGWMKGSPAVFDRELGLFSKELFAFFEATQTAVWASLRKQHQSGLESSVVDALVNALETRGTLDVLRHGFKFYGKKFDCAYFRPAHGLNPDILERYAKNRLVVTRQVKFNPKGDESVDMVLALNGLPIATVELKNHLTGQNVEDAVAQYRARDARHRLFQFKHRTLVHFAIDPDLAYMTTKLAGADTVFLPFNRGQNHGAGNPEHPSGYRTAYVWEEVWSRDSFLDILGRFIHLATEEKQAAGKTVVKETVIFPRYHQLDCVRKLDAAAKVDGVGKSYLIQHSAGSGKSNSIAWLAHRLATLHDEKDAKVFDSVVVITDRRILDKQLQDTIYQFEHKHGVVARIDESSAQLAEALAKGTPIVITTLQKFPFVRDKIGALPKRHYAVIVDEAHSSQSGEAARSMKEVLAVKSLDEAEKEDAGSEDNGDADEQLIKVMESRGRQKNLTFFAFTATPKAKTLEVFGHRDAEGKPVPFHLYSMRQAIEEGFILDVLAHYTTYETYFKLVKAIADDPKVNKKQAATQLARYLSLHPYNLAQKTQVIVEHFRKKVRHKIGGKAKAMVVTASRLHAVRYRQAFKKYLAEKGYDDIGVLVAFSGTVQDPDDGGEYTEPGMNTGKDGKTISEKALAAAFDTDDHQILLVANKYQTGFDQPKLHTMYVDKRLGGVQAVQTLSRLNRIHPGKEDTFVLDFVNKTEDIRSSFQPFYEQTTVAESADPKQLYVLQHRLESSQVFWQAEVDAFCKLFYAPKEKQTVTDQAQMYKCLSPAVDRFKALEEEKQDEFRNALAGFVSLYGFLAQIMPFADVDLEKLYTFSRYLLMKLPQDAKKAPLKLDGDVALKYYRLDKISDGSIVLKLGEPAPLYGPTAVGTRKAKDDEARLSAIIDVLNERFGTTFTTRDQLFFEQWIEAAKADQSVVARAEVNPLDNFELSMQPTVDGLVIDSMEANEELATRYLNDPSFKKVAFKLVVKRIYDDIRARSAASR